MILTILLIASILVICLIYGPLSNMRNELKNKQRKEQIAKTANEKENGAYETIPDRSIAEMDK